MQPCVIYARVSTKEQQNEGYSIPAQIKAIRAFCASQGLSPLAEFVEAESAGKAGRTRFGEMLTYLKSHPEVQVVVAHKLDRLYRNFRDQIELEDLGVRARYVVGDIPDTPQGELLRDVNLSVAKFYLGNLREEVKKGMEEKVAQGGWPHRAPVGFLNDKNTRSLMIDPHKAPLVVYAFERYATGRVSLSMLADELFDRGLSARSGAKVSPSALQKMLKNPLYTGRLRYKGEIFDGVHERLISDELFDRVQATFSPRVIGPKRTKHTFALRDFLVCDECGCKITAENQKGYHYYRCTHGKGREKCAQTRYAREELLMQQLDHILASIEIGPDIIAALVHDAAALDAQENSRSEEELAQTDNSLGALDAKASKLLDGYLEGVVPVEAYRAKSSEIDERRRALERRRAQLACGRIDTSAQVAALAEQAGSARLQFAQADTEGKRDILSTVLLNATVADGSIASYQLKRPFEYLRRDPKGAFCFEWWALEDLNL